MSDRAEEGVDEMTLAQALEVVRAAGYEVGDRVRDLFIVQDGGYHQITAIESMVKVIAQPSLDAWPSFYRVMPLDETVRVKRPAINLLRSPVGEL